MHENLTFMSSEWDRAIAGIALDRNGQHTVVYDMQELIDVFGDKGYSPTAAKNHVVAIFAEARAFPTAPLLFQRTTPAEARALIFEEQVDVGHKA